MKLIRQILFPVLMIVLAGCTSESTGTRDASGVGSVPIGGSGDDVYRAGSPMDEGAGGIMGTRIIYFGFDKTDIESDYRDILAGHARFLAANPDVDVRLEGHTDERNVGLQLSHIGAQRRFEKAPGLGLDDRPLLIALRAVR